ncbi:MAG TPA: chorismate synthase [Selenomonadales bacterium]|nr:chorismate synthase [Selenomonadales bacterium]
MLRFFTAGESHGPCLTAIIEGLPAGLAIDTAAVDHDLARRQRGYGRGGRMRIEQDRVEVVSGLRFGKTLGSPLTLVIRNRDWEAWRDVMAPEGVPQGSAVTAPRPGHADLAGAQKYDHQDIRNVLERASARETAARTAVGGVAKQLLAAAGIQLAAHVIRIGEASVRAEGPYAFAQVRHAASAELGCLDPAAEAAMVRAIQAARDKGDTLGGTFEVMAAGVMPGLGSHVHWDRRLDARLAAALMSIPAVKAVEFGAGTQYAALPGSEAHDEILFAPARGFYRASNRAGGVEGGISNGEDVVARATMKPIPTLMTPLASVDLRTKQPVPANSERSDVCAVPAAAVVGEAVAAIVLAEALLEKFGGDTLAELIAAVGRYRERLGKP